jgi:hypothetical protein
MLRERRVSVLEQVEWPQRVGRLALPARGEMAAVLSLFLKSDNQLAPPLR